MAVYRAQEGEPPDNFSCKQQSRNRNFGISGTTLRTKNKLRWAQNLNVECVPKAVDGTLKDFAAAFMLLTLQCNLVYWNDSTLCMCREDTKVTGWNI